jgi:[ribosomal protein S5]-alanine N-acetyltransferase
MNEKDNIKFDVFIKGDLVDLVVLSEEIVDNSNWYNWFNNEENTKYMQKHYFPNTKKLQLDFFKHNIENNENKLQLGIVHKADLSFIGIVSLNDIDYINKSCEVSIIIGEKKYHSLNIFIESCQSIINHGFKSLGLKKVSSGTFSKDIDSLFCKILGFKREGVLKQAVYKEGKFHDVYICALFNKNYN